MVNEEKVRIMAQIALDETKKKSVGANMINLTMFALMLYLRYGTLP